MPSADPPSRHSDPRHVLGRLGERLAAEHVERRGWEIVERNHRTRYGELDLIARDGDTLVFVEVKTRRAADPSRTWDSLGQRKQVQVRRMAIAYLNSVDLRPRAAVLRFDAIGVTIDSRGSLVALTHLEGAF